jgi:ATP-binding cassette, subfamily B, bacterial PglK
MLETLRSIRRLLSPEEQRRGLAVFALVVVLGILETAGVASIMPFLAVASKPELIQQVGALSWAYRTFDFTSTRSFLIALGFASVALVIVSSMFRLLTNYAMLRFVSMRRHSLARTLFKAHLQQPYWYFLNRNSADLSKGILSEANEVVNTVLRPMAEVIAFSIVILLVVAFLVYVDPRSRRSPPWSWAAPTWAPTSRSAGRRSARGAARSR